MTRDRILATAERLFADYGFDGVSLRQIGTDPLVLLRLYRHSIARAGQSRTGTAAFRRHSGVMVDRFVAFITPSLKVRTYKQKEETP